MATRERRSTPRRSDEDVHVSSWQTRASRARDLATRHPAQAEILTFYGELAGYQEALFGRPSHASAPQSSAFQVLSTGLELERIVGSLPRFLAWLGESAPRRLADAARAMREIDPAEWRALLERSWMTEGHELHEVDQAIVFVIEASLGPLAESLATTSGSAVAGTSAGSRTCPVCTGKAIVGALREEGQGGRRSLVCGFCFTEWLWPRIVCPACGEDTFESLAVFTSDSFPSARIDACDACRTYLKTIDLTKDGHAVPVVDELACVPLDLWAQEQGYSKLRPNLLRM